MARWKTIRRPWKRRYWSKVWKTATCWLWLSTTTEKGYGLFEAHGRRFKAHRLAWYQAHGEIPQIGSKSALVCHKCDVPSCVNPDHLFIGTNADNMRDMVTKRGGPLGKQLTSSRVILRELDQATGSEREALMEFYVNRERAKIIQRVNMRLR